MAKGMESSFVVQRPPRFVLPLAGPLGAVLLAAIAVLSLA
jgi:hypothetical protein